MTLPAIRSLSPPALRMSFVPMCRTAIAALTFFSCSTTKEITLDVCSAKSSIQIPNVYTLRYPVTKKCYVVIGIGWCIIVVIRTITVCCDTALATFIYLIIYINLHIVP